MGRPRQPVTDPTQRQAEVYEFVRDFIRGYGYAPSIREIGTHFGIRSPNGVIANLDALRRKGLLTWTDKVARSLRLTEAGPAADPVALAAENARLRALLRACRRWVPAEHRAAVAAACGETGTLTHGG